MSIDLSNIVLTGPMGRMSIIWIEVSIRPRLPHSTCLIFDIAGEVHDVLRLMKHAGNGVHSNSIA